ncbi:hypothetical protein SLT36_20465 [Aminobacter sp. BA135]|uniref:hypothetical protein n=1 Tax=Aminobacter sp. BA135 TaxID=537596 RepID=UPI003D7AD6EA
MSILMRTTIMPTLIMPTFIMRANIATTQKVIIIMVTDIFTITTMIITPLTAGAPATCISARRPPGPMYRA